MLALGDDMADLDLSKAVNDVIGKGNSYVMTDFFRTGQNREIFVVVKDVASQAFYIFYDEDTTICHKMMGTADDFSAFIAQAYDIKFHISTSKNWTSGMVTYDHIKAKDHAIDCIRYGNTMA